MKQTSSLTERFKEIEARKLDNNRVDTISVSVAEHMPNQSFEFTKVQPSNEKSYQIGMAYNRDQNGYDSAYRKLMEKYIGSMEAPTPESVAFVFNTLYSSLRSEAKDKGEAAFGRPATYMVNNEGHLIWSANDKPEAIGMVLVRKDDSISHLGTDSNMRTGIVRDLSPEDTLYLAPNTVIAAMKEGGAFATNALEGIMNDPTYSVDLVRATFDGNVDNSKQAPQVTHNQVKTEVKKPADRMTRTVMGRKERAAEKKANTAAKASLPDSHLTQAFADNIQAQLDAANTPPTLGFSEMVRLEMEKAQADEKERITKRVEKYTEKVATFEEIAAEALGRRMKGRLFNPLSSAKKEKAKQDDLNMHLLEGFSRALDGALMKQWLAEGYTDEQAAQMVYEHQQTRQEARAARNHEELRKDKLGSFLDKYANMSKGKKIGATIGAAAVFGVVGIGLGAAGGAFAVAGGIGLAGAKVGKTYLQHRSKIYEQGRDESMRSPDTLVSVANGNATKRTAAEQVFAGMAHDEKKREKAIQKADRNKKVAAGLAAISAVAIGAGVAMKVAEHADDIQRILNQPLVSNEVGNADGEWVAEATTPASAPIPEAAPVPAPEIFSTDASTVMNGEGWYQTIQETTGVTDPAQQAAILQKIGPALQEKGWAYPMSDGTWGISRPGTLPKDVLELIKNSR